MNIKLLNTKARIPTRGSEYAAGYDLYAALPETIKIPAHECRKINTGIALEIPDGYFGAIFARSGLSTKKGLRPANCVGVVDSDYRGEVLVPLYNDSSHFEEIENGERIAQIVFLPYLSVDGFNEVLELNQTKRAAGGFGSTGYK